jgi:hypothetical protein
MNNHGHSYRYGEVPTVYSCMSDGRTGDDPRGGGEIRSVSMTSHFLVVWDVRYSAFGMEFRSRITSDMEGITL